MDASLSPMPPDELGPWLAEQQREYAASRQRAGEDAETAARTAAESTAQHFPDGRPGPGHEVFHVVADGHPVGVLWLGPHPHGVRGVTWVYDVEIFAADRGRGLGRAAMLLAEERIRASGGHGIALNVFGDNAVARALYGSLGFEPTAINLHKALD
ncbi:GNAT family N-acetyltransferase [Agromyces seonyuensis]|uniref:GNAT family N-acetyltransferase n=1 Tax=Agromyces seonyuensis TaxID=2662446 RepID=A0A6I4NZF6_9MICO|nr:GNAT family N-acetyltransferase [Agromyces seonyuensis]MWB97815.1 GNAT family N-acetyltransferase [Agromyces seonyuensis]